MGKYLPEGGKLLVLTSPSQVRLGRVVELQNSLIGRKVEVFSEITPNPTLEEIFQYQLNLQQFRPDFILGMGGGSVLDAAKALALLFGSGHNATINDLVSKAQLDSSKRLPIVLIPTTSGTGSEVTPFATVWDIGQKKKHSISGVAVYPDLAYLDVSLTQSLGDEQTLFPALDTISHALESLWNRSSNSVTEAFALQSLRLSIKGLPKILQDSGNMEARQNLQHASVLAGLAISQTKTAIAHSISYPLTLHYGIPHGLACSFTLPKLIRLNRSFFEKMGHGSYNFVNVELLQMLDGLNLGERVRKYVAPEEILELKSEMVASGRAGNYIGQNIAELASLF